MNKDNDIKRIQRLIERCNKCKLKQCENCEISWNDVKAIEEILKYIEDLEKTNEYQAELINDTYINYNDLEFTRIKRRNRELEQEIEELKKKPVNDISKQIINEEIDIDNIEEIKTETKVVPIVATKENPHKFGTRFEKYLSTEEIENKFNELIKAVKQINNKLKEK